MLSSSLNPSAQILITSARALATNASQPQARAPLKLNETFIAFIILILMIITSSKQHLFPAAARTEVDNGGLVRLPPTEKGRKAKNRQDPSGAKT